MYAEIYFSIPVSQSFTYKIPGKYIPFAKPGARVIVPFGPGSKRGYITAVTETLRTTDPSLLSKIKEIKKVIDEIPPLPEELLTLGKWLSENTACSIGESLDCMFPLPSAPIRANGDASHLFSEIDVKTAGILENRENVKPATAGARPQIPQIPEHPGVYSLSGLNAGGREDVYVSIIEKEISSGGGCILVMPDVSSAQEIARRLRVLTNASVSLFHSGLSSTVKADIWKNCLNGKIRVIAGTRTAVFAPVKNLKTIIIENDGSELHKNPQKPFYDTISTAVERSKINQRRIILGSLVPALDTYYRVKKNEYIPVTGSWEPPEVAITTVRKTDRYLSPLLISEVEKRLLKNELSIIYVNRRGFSGAVACPICGDTPKCQACGIPLVYHEKEKILKCHYCGRQEEFTGKCPKCGGVYYFLGAGTERVLKNISGIFPAAEIERVDSDALASENSRRALAAKIVSGRMDIIIATQALSGFYRDFLRPGVKKPTLVSMYNAESFVYAPDFRAIERAFLTAAELAQILDRGGLLLLQTKDPHGEFFRHVNKFDWRGYFEKDISCREELGYPPAVRLINLIMRSKSREALEKFAQEAFNSLEEKFEPSVITLLGPDEPPRAKIRGEERRHILIKIRGGEIKDVSSAIMSLKPKKGIRVAADVNPYEII